MKTTSLLTLVLSTSLALVACGSRSINEGSTSSAERAGHDDGDAAAEPEDGGDHRGVDGGKVDDDDAQAEREDAEAERDGEIERDGEAEHEGGHHGGGHP